MSSTQQLLKEYVRGRSERAFEELVHRYNDLVYSAALRRVGGETLLAQDVTQLVFTDLARKAAALGEDVMLGGWLHRHTGFVAASLVRGEQRRRNREKQAVEMNALNQSSNSDWQEVAPLLDEAIDQLDAADRDAVVLRYFERCDFRTVGAALGATEDAAQKRVSRALEKLRDFLVKRGATLSDGALGAVIGERSVEAAPAGLAAGVSKAALSAIASGVGGGVFATLVKLLTPAGAKLALGAATVVVIAAIWISRSNSGGKSAHAASAASPINNPALTPPAPDLAQATAEPSARTEAAAPIDSNALHLVIVAAESGKPVPNVQIDYRGWEGEEFTRRTLTANRFGICEVAIPRSTTTHLELATRSDGFADTRLHWQKDHGEVIPAAYTLRLVRPTPIGGYVLDPDGHPLAGAKVGFNHADDPATAKSPEDHHFGWIQVSTDTNGHWSIERIAPEMIRSVYGSSSHPDFVQAPVVIARQNKQTEEALRAGTYAFHLGRPVTAHGIVTDPDGSPVVGARILVGKRGVSDSKKGESVADGSFVVTGCRPGKNPVSAEAEGFAAATVEADLSADSEPVRLTLQRGKTLMLRLLNQAGQPVSQAQVWLDTMRQVPINDPEYGKLAVQADFQGAPDAQGYVIWSNAPDTELIFDVSASGYMRVNGLKVHPDGQEHVIDLPPAVVVSGTVRDALNGQPIPHFRIVAGWPVTNFLSRILANVRSNAGPPGLDHVSITNKGGPTNLLNDSVSAKWSSFARDRLEFTDGKFRHAFEAPLIYGMANPGYMLKFEADGYVPFISRPIRADEGKVQLEVILQAAKETLVTVLLPDGRPAAQADVGLVMPQAGLELIPGGLSHQSLSGAALLLTDTAGNFRLPSDENISRVLFAHSGGYAEASPVSLASDPTIRLGAWGRLEGTYLIGGQPAFDRELLFSYGSPDAMSVHTSYESYRVKTDQAGRFVFEQVPPGRHKVVKLVPVAQTDPELKGSFMHVPVAEVEIHPGETTTITVGIGYSIKALLRWPDGIKPGAGRQAVAHIQTGYPAELREAMQTAVNDPAALAMLQQSEEMQQYMQIAQHFQAVITDDRTVSAESIPAGNYILVVGVVPEASPGKSLTSWIAGETSFTVPTAPANGVLDLGEILLSERKLAAGQP